MHRLALFDNDAIKSAFVDQLRTSRERLRFRLLAWVIMPEHVHLIIVPNEHYTVTAILMALKRPFAARVLARWRELNAPILPRLLSSDGDAHFWQAGGGYDRNLEGDVELTEKTEYCHANPQVRGLVRSPIDWPWSSALWYAGNRHAALLEIDEFGFS